MLRIPNQSAGPTTAAGGNTITTPASQMLTATSPMLTDQNSMREFLELFERDKIVDQQNKQMVSPGNQTDYNGVEWDDLKIFTT